MKVYRAPTLPIGIRKLKGITNHYISVIIYFRPRNPIAVPLTIYSYIPHINLHCRIPNKVGTTLQCFYGLSSLHLGHFSNHVSWNLLWMLVEYNCDVVFFFSISSQLQMNYIWSSYFKVENVIAVGIGSNQNVSLEGFNDQFKSVTKIYLKHPLG